jgi:hypothetical protein
MDLEQFARFMELPSVALHLVVAHLRLADRLSLLRALAGSSEAAHSSVTIRQAAQPTKLRLPQGRWPARPGRVLGWAHAPRFLWSKATEPSQLTRHPPAPLQTRCTR